MIRVWLLEPMLSGLQLSVIPVLWNLMPSSDWTTCIRIHTNIQAETNLTPMINIILYKGKLKAFPLIERIGRCPLYLLLLNIMLGALTRALRQDKEIKEKKNRKEEVKLFLFADEMILYLRDSRHHQKKSYN